MFVNCFSSISVENITNCWAKCGITSKTKTAGESHFVNLESLSNCKPEVLKENVESTIDEEEDDIDEEGFQKIPPSLRVHFEKEATKIDNSSSLLQLKLKEYNLCKGHTIGDGVCSFILITTLTGLSFCSI
jgi:hypothetical protein